MNKSKVLIIAGGLAVAGGAIWYIRKSEKPKPEPEGNAAPTTYFSSQEASGNPANFGGGGAPGGSREGVTTSPEPEHSYICKPGEQAVGVSALGGKPGGIQCINRNQVQIQPEPKQVCSPGFRPVGISGVANQTGGIRCVQG